ncbi:hypothetical protein BGZ65_006892 [Modicella reniformis]|uniref:N-acetyltransferase domain-containing protein n=1 Tax=Modicella reniformis TaxID=1440133 RepID=A0A9P6MBA3_9FUNG|nr:hypothetical protein BGZ65_006892 [Modicella reniformis]
MTTEQDHSSAPEKPRAMGPYLICENPPHYLSAVDFGDIPEMVRVLNINKDIFEGTASFQYPYLESHAQARISRAHGNTTRLGFNTHWAMRTSSDGPIMGWIHAYVHPEVQQDAGGKPLRVCDVGYWVSPEFMRQGYATRSARFVTHEICFKELGFDIVRAEAYTHNRGSRRILEYAGMQCEVESKTAFIPKLQENRIICCYAVHRDDSIRSVDSK